CFPYRAIRRELDMRIAIMGSGAVGGYFGARLAAGGSDVTFLARGAHLAAMRERGLTVESPLGDIRLAQVKAGDNPQAIGPVDLVIVAVKLWDTEQAARRSSRWSAPAPRSSRSRTACRRTRSSAAFSA